MKNNISWLCHCLFVCELSEIDTPTSHDQHMTYMVYIADDATQLVGHSGELLNENTAF